MNSKYSLILATDLDGTFLGGSPQQRKAFYQSIHENRHRILLIFVTGRSLQLIQNLYEEPDLPQPDYIIGDVGTTVYQGDTLEPMTPVQDWIAQRWGNANEKVKAMLADEPGLQLQPQAAYAKYRVSYNYQPDQLQPTTLDKIADAGFHAVLSADKYFDVLPKGVAKGSTLLKLIDTLNLHPDSVITAGDSLNDLSLFETGLKSIAVGNSEPKLVAKIQDLRNVYHSPEPGVAGIQDGIEYHFNSKR